MWSDAVPQRDQFAEEAINHRAFGRLSLGSRHYILYIHYIYIYYIGTLTHKYIYVRTYDRPSTGIKIVQIYRARSVQVHRAALDLLRSVRVFGRSVRCELCASHCSACLYALVVTLAIRNSTPKICHFVAAQIKYKLRFLPLECWCIYKHVYMHYIHFIYFYYIYTKS